MSKLIYLDNAATTQVYPEVLQEMLPYFSEVYSNPSAIYSFASESKKAVDKARTSVAELINAKTDEIYFTGGGSESDNWALKATADAYASKGKHIITSTIEHHAILHTCAYLEKKGFEICAGDSGIDRRLPFMAVFAPPPCRFVTAIGNRLRRERQIVRHVPFTQQRILVILPAIVKETLPHARLRSASG